jgi:hypothetical protein
MNKTERVAWHKHLKKAKKRAEKIRVEQHAAAHPVGRPGAPGRR